MEMMTHSSKGSSGLDAEGAEPHEGSPPAVLTTVEKSMVLEVAETMFTYEAWTSGVASILYVYVERNKLYVDAGCSTMAAYADEKLGVKTAASARQYSRAGQNFFSNFPEEAERLIASIASGTSVTRVTLEKSLGRIPGVAILRELGPAMARLDDPQERTALLEKVKSGEITHRTIRDAGRHLNVLPAPQRAKGQGSTATPATGGSQATHLAEIDTFTAGTIDGFKDADLQILEDAHVLAAAARKLEKIRGSYQELVDAWERNATKDVRPVIPKLRAVVEALARIETTVWTDIVPAGPCPTCRGTTRECADCSNRGWVPVQRRDTRAEAVRNPVESKPESKPTSSKAAKPKPTRKGRTSKKTEATSGKKTIYVAPKRASKSVGAKPSSARKNKKTPKRGK